MTNEPVPLLDHGYVRLVESWGSDERIIEAARMSTNKGFIGWGEQPCPTCVDGTYTCGDLTTQCPSCKGRAVVAGDEKLLAYLHAHHHSTPFEMAGMVIEVQAPIFVFREWHRHRTQSYNELSARYTPLPNVNYVPSVNRCTVVQGSPLNRQATGNAARTPTTQEAINWLNQLDEFYQVAQQLYDAGLSLGIPKEVARLPVPVGRYSCMRASANLRNWLAFMTLRCANDAQWEIRQYAQQVAVLVEQCFPRTWELWARDQPRG